MTARGEVGGLKEKTQKKQKKNRRFVVVRRHGRPSIDLLCKTWYFVLNIYMTQLNIFKNQRLPPLLLKIMRTKQKKTRTSSRPQASRQLASPPDHLNTTTMKCRLWVLLSVPAIRRLHSPAHCSLVTSIIKICQGGQSDLERRHIWMISGWVADVRQMSTSGNNWLFLLWTIIIILIIINCRWLLEMKKNNTWIAVTREDNLWLYLHLHFLLSFFFLILCLVS